MKALDKERDQLGQRASQMIRDTKEYEQLYQEILQRHGWSKGTASRNGFRGVAAVITQCRKSVENQSAEAGENTQSAQEQSAAPAAPALPEQSPIPEDGFLGQSKSVI